MFCHIIWDGLKPCCCRHLGEWTVLFLHSRPALIQYSCVALDGTGKRAMWERLRGLSSGSPSFGSGLCLCLSCVVLVPILASPDAQLASWLYLGPTWSPPTSVKITGLSADPCYCWQTCSSHLAWGLWDGDLADEATLSTGFVLTQLGGAASSCCSLTLTCCYQVAITGWFIFYRLQIKI